jgi:hypothetical protein
MREEREEREREERGERRERRDRESYGCIELHVHTRSHTQTTCTFTYKLLQNK